MNTRLFLGSFCLCAALHGAAAMGNEGVTPLSKDDVITVDLKEVDAGPSAPHFDFYVVPGGPRPGWEAPFEPPLGRVMLVKTLPPHVAGGAPRVLFYAADPAAPAGPEPAPRDILFRAGEAVTRPLEMKKVAYLGVSTSPVSSQLASHLKLPEGFGLIVDHVQPGEPAEKAGLKAHDVLTKLGDQRLVNAMQLGALVRSHKPGDEVEFTVIREGKEMQVKAKLVEKEVPAMALNFEAGGEHGIPFQIRLPDGLPGAPGVRVAPGTREKFIAQRVMRFADDEHQLEIKPGPGGKRELIVTDKAGKELFRGPIDTDEQRKAVPEAIRPKLEKLEKSAAIRVRAIGAGRPGIDAGPQFEDLEIELVKPFDADGIKKMIEEQLKGLKLEGDQQEQLKQRIEEMKARIDEMKKKLHEQHPGFRGGAFDGPEPIPGALPAGGNAGVQFSKASAVASMSDDEHQITVRTDEAGKHLTAKDKAGKELFNGPINTDEERAKVPEEIRAKLKTLESSVRVDRSIDRVKRGGEPEPRPRADKESDR
jgi:serine protease Do